MKRSTTVVWQGPGKEGSGQITSQSKVLDKANYAYNTRFEDEKGTNPEELIAAAHASCFTMKLAFMLNEAGFSVDSIETTSTVTLEGSTLTESHLDVKAKVPVISSDKFEHIAEKTKNECPVSKALNMNITMEARLVNEDVHKELTI
jgi:osmotically inducible protein OsmC